MTEPGQTSGHRLEPPADPQSAVATPTQSTRLPTETRRDPTEVIQNPTDMIESPIASGTGSQGDSDDVTGSVPELPHGSADGALHTSGEAESLASQAFVGATVSVVATHGPKAVSFVSTPCNSSSSSALPAYSGLTDSPRRAQGPITLDPGAEDLQTETHVIQPPEGAANCNAKAMALQVRTESVPSVYWLGEGTGTPRPHDPDDSDSYKPNQATTEARLALRRSHNGAESVPRLERLSSGESYHEDDDAPPSSRRVSAFRSKSAANLGRFLGKWLSMNRREAVPHVAPVERLPSQSTRGKEINDF